MQLGPPTPSIWNDLAIAGIGIFGAGLFASCSVAVRRANAYLDGTTLYYTSGWRGYRHVDLARVTDAHVVEDKRDEGYDLRLSGNGNLKKFPIAHPAPGFIPDLSREIIATALASNPNKAATAKAVATLRTGWLESSDDSSHG